MAQNEGGEGVCQDKQPMQTVDTRWGPSSQEPLQRQLCNSWVKPVRRPRRCEAFLKLSHNSHKSLSVICKAGLAATQPTFSLIRSLSVVLIKHEALRVQSRMYPRHGFLSRLTWNVSQELFDFDFLKKKKEKKVVLFTVNMNVDTYSNAEKKVQL